MFPTNVPVIRVNAKKPTPVEPIIKLVSDNTIVAVSCLPRDDEVYSASRTAVTVL
jgi:hypothetical protein